MQGAWTQTSPFEGQRALRIDARHGTHAWQSQAIQILESGKYLLIWQTRFHGDKSWRFESDFCGVKVMFFDERDRVVDTVQKHSSCWQTSDWRPAWLALSVPSEAKSLVIQFGAETKHPLPGGFDVDSIELHRWPFATPTDGQARLELRVVDEHKLSTGSRVRIANSRRDTLRAVGSIDYVIGGAFHPLEEGKCHLSVPPDTYSITITKGFEYWPHQRAASIGAEDTLIEVELERAWSWPDRGWYCGDHQAHLHRHGGSRFPMLTWRDVLRVARSEGLDFLPFMGADRYPLPTEKAATELRRADLAAELTDEITDDLWGHVCPIGAGSEARSDSRYDEGPMNFDRNAAMAGVGLLCYAHPYGRLTGDESLAAVADPRVGHLAREFPIDLALGMTCGFDLLTMEGQQNRLDRKLRDLYRLFNLGFRFSLTASTDFHVDQARQPIGAARTYVRSGALQLPAIAEAYRRGRTFATNGPLIDLQVAGAFPGDEIGLPDAQRSVAVSVEAVSIGRLERAEIIVNGETLHVFAPTEPHRIQGEVSLPIRESSWLAVRVVGPDDPHLASEMEGCKLCPGQFAHTSPIYVLVNEKPILAGSQEDARYFVRWCDAALEAWRIHLLDNPQEVQHDRLVHQRIEEAKRVFLNLATRLRSIQPTSVPSASAK